MFCRESKDPWWKIGKEFSNSYSIHFIFRNRSGIVVGRDSFGDARGILKELSGAAPIGMDRNRIERKRERGWRPSPEILVLPRIPLERFPADCWAIAQRPTPTKTTATTFPCENLNRQGRPTVDDVPLGEFSKRPPPLKQKLIHWRCRR